MHYGTTNAGSCLRQVRPSASHQTILASPAGRDLLEAGMSSAKSTHHGTVHYNIILFAERCLSQEINCQVVIRPITILPVGREVLEAGVLLGSEVLHGSFEGRIVAGHDVLFGLQGVLPLLPLTPCAADFGTPLAQGLLCHCSPSQTCHAVTACHAMPCS